MKVHFITPVLDGMPWITFHYPIFRQLPFDWVWHVVEGVASNVKCTQWCRPLKPRLSRDGTKQYLDSLAWDARVHIYRSEMWHGKLSMVNEPLKHIGRDCLLWQVDSDEVWTVDQICKMRTMFLENPKKNAAFFWCRYFLGPRIITSTRDTYGNNSDYEWHRVWRIGKGMEFQSHEPPVIKDLKLNPFTHEETERNGLVFDHYAYALETQVAFKEEFYGYSNAVREWRKLQHNQEWPAHVSKFLPWVKDKAKCVAI